MIKKVLKKVQLICDDESLTHQSFKDESDINNIVNKYKRSGVLTHVTNQVAKFGDFSDVPSYHEAMNIVTSAQQQFDQLPAPLRKRFYNDPALFLDFVGDEKNISEMRELGLLKPEVSAPNVAPLEASSSDSNPS